MIALRRSRGCERREHGFYAGSGGRGAGWPRVRVRRIHVHGVHNLLIDRRKAIIVQYEDVHNIIYSFKIRYDIRNQREI